MKLKLKNFTPAIVLGAICLIVAAILAVVNHFTAPVIAENERIARTASLRAVFGGDESGADFDTPLAALPEGTPSTVAEIYAEKNGKGYAVVLVVPKGYEGEIDLTVGVDMNGKLTGISITKYNDSLGKDKMGDAVNALVGKGSGELGDDVLVSGATFSSKAVKAAIEDALTAVGLVKASAAKLASYETVPEPTEAEIIAKGMELILGAESFEAVDISGKLYKGTKAIYKETSGRGYVVYCKTATQYNPDETRFIFALDENFTVTGIELLRWTTGTYEGMTEPGSPAIDTLLHSIVGVNKKTFAASVDLVTGATGTSGNIMAAVAEAVNFLDENLEAHILSSASGMFPEAAGFEPVEISEAGLAAGIKRMYKATSGEGYVVYAMTSTKYNPQETEFVFALNKNMKVVGFDLWFWSTGTYAGMTGTDAPAVDLLEKSFIGATRFNFDQKVDLVSGATGTTDNVKAAVMAAMDQLDPPAETNVYKIIATVAFFAGIAALGVAIYFQRRRRG